MPLANTASPKKAVFISVGSLFCQAADDDFNEVNVGLVRDLRAKDYHVILMYGNESQAQSGLGAVKRSGASGVVGNPLYTPKGTFTGLMKACGVDPQNALFISAGSAVIEMMENEGLNICEASVKSPRALVSKVESHVYNDSRENFAKIKAAVDAFVLK